MQLFGFFKRRSISSIENDELHQTELDLLKAEHGLEYFEYEVSKLRERRERLLARLGRTKDSARSVGGSD